MSFSTLAIRTVGIVGTALTLKEINGHSKEHASYETREKMAENLTDLLIKHNVNTDGTELTNELQKHYMEWRMDDKTIPTIQYVKNRVSGFGHALMTYAIPLGLGVAAMLAKSSSKLRIYKGYVPKPLAGAAAIGLGIMAAVSFSRNVLGWGSNHPKGFYP